MIGKKIIQFLSCSYRVPPNGASSSNQGGHVEVASSSKGKDRNEGASSSLGGRFEAFENRATSDSSPTDKGMTLIPVGVVVDLEGARNLEEGMLPKEEQPNA